jgi:hypothetical protein
VPSKAQIIRVSNWNKLHQVKAPAKIVVDNRATNGGIGAKI